MSLHLWEAVHDAKVRSEPLFDIPADMVRSEPPSLQRVLLAAATLWCRSMTWNGWPPLIRRFGVFP